jgi:hypothetical protein
MYKSVFYLLFIFFGIIIYLLWNGKDGFSVGVQSDDCEYWASTGQCDNDDVRQHCPDACSQSTPPVPAPPVPTPPVPAPPVPAPPVPPVVRPPVPEPPSPTVIPPCTPYLTEYTDNILDWSTNQNPYGVPMFDNDTSNYLDQGHCGTCQTYALTSCLSCLYNIEVYKIHLNNNNCNNFTPITISPRSIIDIILKYKLNKTDYSRPCTQINKCGLDDYDYDLNTSTSVYIFLYLQNNLFSNTFNTDNYPLIRNHSVKNDKNIYMNITQCPSQTTHLFDESVGSLSDPNFSHVNIFNPIDLIYMNYGNAVNISETFSNSIISQLDNNPLLTPQDIISEVDFITRLKTELKIGPIILGISISTSLHENGLLDIINLHDGRSYNMISGAHNLLLIGYDNNNAIILNSWNPHIGSGDTPGILQYYITNDIPLSDIYGDFMNWFDIYRPQHNNLLSNTEICRINITIPDAQKEQISQTIPYISNIPYAGIVGGLGIAAMCAANLYSRRNRQGHVVLNDDDDDINVSVPVPETLCTPGSPDCP